MLDQVVPQEQEKARRQTGQMIAAMNGNSGAGRVSQFADVAHSIQNTIPKYVLDELKRAIPDVARKEHKTPSQFGFALDTTRTTDVAVDRTDDA